MKEKYREYYRQYGKDLRAFRKRQGLCIHCGKEKAEEGLSVCTICKLDGRERANRYYQEMSPEKKTEHLAKKKALYDERRAQGLCVRCGQPAYNNFAFCKKHHFERNDYLQKKRGFKND